MAYDPKIHHRRSIRLKGYDYSQEGLYYVTICVQNKDYLFGKIIWDSSPDKHQMIENDAGIMIEKWFHELKNKFPDIECGPYVVMPNHFHCIIENNGNLNILKPVGADQCVRPHDLDSNQNVDNKQNPCSNQDLIVNQNPHSEQNPHSKQKGEHAGSPLRVPYQNNKSILDDLFLENSFLDGSFLHDLNLGDSFLGEHTEVEHTGSPLHNVVQWFKTMSTNEYIRGVKTLGWQRFEGKLWQRGYYEHIIRDQTSYDIISEYIHNNPQNWDTDKLKLL